MQSADYTPVLSRPRPQSAKARPQSAGAVRSRPVAASTARAEKQLASVYAPRPQSASAGSGTQGVRGLRSDAKSRSTKPGAPHEVDLLGTEARLLRWAESLWEELRVPRHDRRAFVDSLGRDLGPSRKSCVALAAHVRLLRNHRADTIAVVRAIQLRERSLAALATHVDALQAEESAETEASNDGGAAAALGEALEALNNASAQTVQAIETWRQLMWRPRGFVWREENYLVKMRSDAAIALRRVPPRALAQWPRWRSAGIHAAPEEAEVEAQPQLILFDAVFAPTPAPASTDDGELAPLQRWLNQCADARSASCPPQLSPTAQWHAVTGEDALQRAVKREAEQLARSKIELPLLRWLPPTTPPHVWQAAMSVTAVPSGPSRTVPASDAKKTRARKKPASQAREGEELHATKGDARITCADHDLDSGGVESDKIEESGAALALGAAPRHEARKEEQREDRPPATPSNPSAAPVASAVHASAAARSKSRPRPSTQVKKEPEDQLNRGREAQLRPHLLTTAQGTKGTSFVLCVMPLEIFGSAPPPILQRANFHITGTSRPAPRATGRGRSAIHRRLDSASRNDAVVSPPRLQPLTPARAGAGLNTKVSTALAPDVTSNAATLAHSGHFMQGRRGVNVPAVAGPHEAGAAAMHDQQGGRSFDGRWRNVFVTMRLGDQEQQSTEIDGDFEGANWLNPNMEGPEGRTNQINQQLADAGLDLDASRSVRASSGTGAKRGRKPMRLATSLNPTAKEQLPPLLFNVSEELLLCHPLEVALWRAGNAELGVEDELLGATRVRMERFAGAVGDQLTATGDVQLDVEVPRSHLLGERDRERARARARIAAR